uniref:Uncharacterized protein n=1 Tax=Fagus sylvatica TaxID=28930 RepID=A0A2N9IIC8_FAGSY
MRPWKPRRDRGGQMTRDNERPWRSNEAVEAIRPLGPRRPWRSNEAAGQGHWGRDKAIGAARGRVGRNKAIGAARGRVGRNKAIGAARGRVGRDKAIGAARGRVGRSWPLRPKCDRIGHDKAAWATSRPCRPFLAPQGGLYHGHSYPDDLGRCSYLPSSRSFKLLKVLLTAPVLVRFFAPQGGLYHGHSYPGDLGRCSYLPSSRSFKLLKVLLTTPVLVSRFGSGPLGSGSDRLGPVWIRLGPGSVPARISSDPACAWRALACAWHALAHAGMCWAWGDRRSFHRRVAAPMRPFFTPFFRSGDEDPDGGIHCSIRCPEEWVLETVGTAARGGAWSFLAGALTGAWRRVRAPMVVIFLGFDRSGDDLLDGSPHSTQTRCIGSHRRRQLC